MVYVFLANGFEEMEALAPVDLLRRAGVEVFTVGVGSDMIVSSHNIPVKTDTTVDKIVLNDELEMIVLPGGMPGTLNLEASPDVLGAVDYCADNNRYIAAICAAVDGKFITAKGAGCSMKFALKLVELLVSKEKAEALESGMQSK